MLQSQKGKGGGYLLRVPPGEVNFSKVLRIIDGPIAPALCVSMFFYGKCDDCKDEETCSLRTVLERWRDANLAVLDKTTLNTQPRPTWHHNASLADVKPHVVIFAKQSVVITDILI